MFHELAKLPDSPLHYGNYFKIYKIRCFFSYFFLLLDFLYVFSHISAGVFNCVPFISLKKVLPVQKAAARTLCVYLRYNRKQEQRHEVIQKLIERKIIFPLLLRGAS